jgi:hydrolase, TatD family
MITRALDEGVCMIAVGTSVETSRAGVELARKYPGKIWATVGIHPTETDIHNIEKLRLLAQLPEVVAIGECGLDYYHLPNDGAEARSAKMTQCERFIAHIELAKAIGKPLVVHCRKAYTDMAPLLKTHAAGLGGVIHFFQGTTDEAREFLDIGFYISFAGPITFAEEYRGVVAGVPLHRILAETDAPYAAPNPYRGKRNEPLYVKFVIEKIAEIKERPLDEVAEAISINVKTLFRID